MAVIEIVPDGQEIKVEIHAHWIQKPVIRGGVKVGEIPQRVAQNIVRAGGDGKLAEVAIVGTQPGAPINWLWHGMPTELKDAVRAAIAADMGAGDRKEAEPPDPVEVQKVMDQINGAEDDDE